MSSLPSRIRLSPAATLVALSFVALWQGCAPSPGPAPVVSKVGPPPNGAVSAASSADTAVAASAYVASPSRDAGVSLDSAPDRHADASLVPAEHWGPDLHSDDDCQSYHEVPYVTEYHDPHGSKRNYGYDGYVFRRVRVTRVIDGVRRVHCARVYHPKGYRSNQGKTVYIRDRIDDAWYRLIENTLDRTPWRHLQNVRAFVIDNRPLLHGVASFDRRKPETDARDGHTIWLNERLFTRDNHWAHGNYGYYWAYHVQRDGEHVDGQRPDHDLFSPVLLHEIGHIVNYNVVNGHAWDPTCPPCAYMCGDMKNCDDISLKQKQSYCATAYCTGFGFSSGTENWAEMYRWFYQGSDTRAMLRERFPKCYSVFDDGLGGGINAGLASPWERGLGGVVGYHPTRWDKTESKHNKHKKSKPKR